MTLETPTSPPPAPDPDAEAKPRPDGVRRLRVGRMGAGRLIGLGLAVLLVLILLVALAAYLNRRAVARAALVGWLDQRGIVADVEIERLEIDGFVGRIRIGDPARPDLVVERAEVDYALVAPWATGGAGVRPERVRLVRPLLRAVWSDGRLSLGSLDPLLKEFTAGPPRPDSRAPTVIVEGGRLSMGGDYGPLEVLADGRMEDGKLMRLKASVPSTRLNGGGVRAQALQAGLDLTTTGDRVAVRAWGSAAQLTVGDTEGRGARFTATGDLPYPDLKRRRGDGQAVIRAEATADRLSLGAVRADGAALTYGFDGRTQGWIEAFDITGRSSATLKARTIDGDGMAARGLAVGAPDLDTRLTRTDQGLQWRAAGATRASATSARTGDLSLTNAVLSSPALTFGGRGGAVEAVGPIDVRAGRGAFGDISLSGVTGRVGLDMVHDGATLIEVEGGLKSTGGAWPLFGPLATDDLADLKAMKLALGDFSVDLPGLKLAAGTPGVEVALTQPARLSPRNGGVLTVRPANSPLYSAGPGALGEGALSLSATRGRGLPQAEVAVPRWRLTPGGFEARLDADAALDFDVARGLSVQTTGLLASDRAVLTFRPAGCVAFSIQTLELGENDVERATGGLCPTDRPLFENRQGGWRAEGVLRDVSAHAPFLQAEVGAVTGSLVATGGPSGVGLEARIGSARVTDAAEPRRFHPLTASGRVVLDREVWTGGFGLRSGDTPVGALALRHDGGAEAGGLTFDTGELTFAEAGLQPHDLTPLVTGVVSSPVTGAVRFAGRIDWSPTLPEGGSSSGRLTIPGLDFVSPAGPVKGLKGAVAFTSLTPLITAGDQTLTVDSLETVTPLTALGVTFAIDDAALKVAGGEISAAQGLVRLEPLNIPLDRSKPFQGTLALDRVQLGDLIVAAGATDAVSLDAVVSGRLPFTVDPVLGVRIQGGRLEATQPGRVSIRREALAGLDAAGGGEGVPPGMVEDLAYQAMRNLAFDSLSADVNSLDSGRLGVLFHIKGRHDPPQRQELRIGLADFISRRFLERTLPLPSDTGIDLTLDTTLNLNELIEDLLAARRVAVEQAQP